ncbi:MAG: hypothetical protein P9M13_02335 [Candidatus Ancaeobacter aquaticus]|nr:hypothetical protein [Candidatus Ancaeobacter aquaticus]
MIKSILYIYRIYIIVFISMLIAYQVLAQYGNSLENERIDKGYGLKLTQVYSNEVPLGGFLSAALVSGFRGVVADLLWLKCDHYWHTSQWYKLVPMYYLITRLQPQFIQPWVIGGWHMAYNVSHKVAHEGEEDNKSDLHAHDNCGEGCSHETSLRLKTIPHEPLVKKCPSESDKEHERQKWVDRGILFLKDGLQYNDKTYELYFELGWLYYYKVKDYKESLYYFKNAVGYKHPLWVDRMLAHAYEKCGDYRGAYATWEKVLKAKDGVDGPAQRILKRLKNKMSGS